MPPKKIGRKTNKKKGNKASRSSSATTPPTYSTAANNGTAAALPDMSEFERRTPIHPDDYPTVYQRYKNATKRFFVYMEKQARVVGAGIASDESIMSVNTLMNIADQMDSEGRTIDPMALKDLKLAIRVRSRVAKSLFGGGDSGHQHFLAVLTYCWTILDKLPKEASNEYVEPICSKSNNSYSQENRFEVFQDGIDDEELDDTDAEVFPSYVPRPEPEQQPMSLESLLNSDERHDAALFLFTLDNIMGMVSRQYQSVVQYHQNNVELGVSPSDIVPTLIWAAVATNMGIQQVHRMEIELSLQYPHLSNIYRLIATVELPDFSNKVISVLLEHAAEKVTEREVIVFLGDCLECSMGKTSAADSYNQAAEFIVPEFCTRYKVDTCGAEKLRQLVLGLTIFVMFEEPVAPDTMERISILSLMKSDAPLQEPHSWFANMSKIGGERSICHTIRLLQIFGDVLKQTPVGMAPIGEDYFGPSWVQGRPSNIAGDMDELLMADILPQLYLIFKHGILGNVELPMMDDIAPLWMIFRAYVKHPEKKVSWSLAFSVHALLTSILETDQITDSLLSLSECVFQKFFKQLEWADSALQNGSDSFLNGPSVCSIIRMVGAIELIDREVFVKRAIWNPLYAGSMLSYLTYFGNLEAGCLVVDNRAQLRIVMFLYHGLMLNGIIEIGQIPFLDVLYASFKNSRAIWDGELPHRGELIQKFWTSCGINLVDSKKWAQAAKELYAFRNLAGGRIDGIGRSLIRNRRMTRPKPEEISKSFRRVCNNDFHDVVDKYCIQELENQSKRSDLYAFAVRINDTLDAIYEEEPLLSFNFLSCAVILEQFVCGLIRIMKWDRMIRSRAENPSSQQEHRMGAMHLFAHHVLGALDFSLDPMDHEFCQVPLVRTSSTFLTTFFTEVDPLKVQWFNARNEHSGSEGHS